MSYEKQLQAELEKKKIDPAKIAGLISADSSLVDSIFDQLSSKNPGLKFGCAKSLLLVSEKSPGLLCPNIARIFELLDSENQILKWNAIAILGNVAAVGLKFQIRSVLPKIYGFLSGGELITANHAIAALGKIARAFPEEQETIASRLLSIEHAPFPTDECRNIAIGKSLLALGMFPSSGNVQTEVIEFARRQTRNTRTATAEKAKTLLHRYPAPARAGA